jgi:hypothetical protein
MIAVQNQEPSTLADVIGQVREAFSAMGDNTPIMVGRQYRSVKKTGTSKIGSPPIVIFAPEAVPGAGKIKGPRYMGWAGNMVHSCLVYVRAKETGDDLERFKACYKLADRVIACIEVAASGRLEWLSLDDGSPVDVDAYGVEVVLGFTYSRDIPHDAKRWALPPAGSDTSVLQPHPPPGIPADGVIIDPTTTPAGN